MEDNVEWARHRFAEDLRVAAGITTPAILDAFERVPREKLVGPVPWRVGNRLVRKGEPEGGRCDHHICRPSVSRAGARSSPPPFRCCQAGEGKR